MPIYEESGLKIRLPDGESFRFQDCPNYNTLKGKNLSEMDFGWWDSSKDTLWLLELKDYSLLTPLQKLPDYLLEKLINKVTDSLMILSSVWSDSIQGQKFCGDLQAVCHLFPIHPKKMKIVFILKITDTNIKSQLSPLKTRLNDKLKGRLLLFDINNVTLVDHETASTMGLAIASI